MSAQPRSTYVPDFIAQAGAPPVTASLPPDSNPSLLLAVLWTVWMAGTRFVTGPLLQVCDALGQTILRGDHGATMGALALLRCTLTQRFTHLPELWGPELKALGFDRTERLDSVVTQLLGAVQLAAQHRPTQPPPSLHAMSPEQLRAGMVKVQGQLTTMRLELEAARRGEPPLDNELMGLVRREVLRALDAFGLPCAQKIAAHALLGEPDWEYVRGEVMGTVISDARLQRAVLIACRHLWLGDLSSAAMELASYNRATVTEWCERAASSQAVPS